NDKVSFCVVSKDEVVPEELTTYFKSVIIFGKAKKLDGEELKNAAIQLGLKYYNNKDAVDKEIEKAFERMACYEIAIEHITGKQAKELMNKH
ncbi:MAG: pyridoxamine 5'-phosphate oxidase family protein, partial [Candidatus Riflebacteria bacterium]|nr:pyridoxamine 5'-phosphate oxidase family protein [Candidatus Riflebacteria bacterium]